MLENYQDIPGEFDILNLPVEFASPHLQLFEAIRSEAIVSIVNSEYDDANPTAFLKEQHHNRGVIAVINKLLELHSQSQNSKLSEEE